MQTPNRSIKMPIRKIIRKDKPVQFNVECRECNQIYTIKPGDLLYKVVKEQKLKTVICRECVAKQLKTISSRIIISLSKLFEYFLAMNSSSHVINYTIKDECLYLYVDFTKFFNDLGVFIKLFYDNVLKESSKIKKICLTIKDGKDGRIVIMLSEDIINYMTGSISVETFFSKVKWI